MGVKGTVKFAGYKDGHFYKAKGEKNKRKKHKADRKRNAWESKLRTQRKREEMEADWYNS